MTLSTVATYGGGARRPSLLDPCRYVREADEALEDGDREAALVLIARAYFAFDLCSAGCEFVRAWGRGSSERNN